MADLPRLTDDKRSYHIPGIRKPLPRVSTVLAIIHSQGLEDWQREKGFEEADQIGAEAADYGNCLHAACEAINYGVPIVKGDPDVIWKAEDGFFTNNDDVPLARDAMRAGKPSRFVVREDCWASANRWGDYLAEKVEQVLYAEHIVWSEQFGFAGSLDNCLLMRDGRIVLGDFKSSNWLKWPYRVQLAFYQVGLWQTERVKADLRMMFDMPKKKPGKLFVVPYHDHEFDWMLARAALALYRGDVEYRNDWKLAWSHEWKGPARSVEAA